jgi:hypothetical protein
MIDHVTGNKPLPVGIKRDISSVQTAFRCSWRK